jgi:iron complex outermembrane receptor protein
MNLRNTLLCGAALLACTTVANQAAAEAAPAATTAQTQTIGEVVVTARRHEESLQKVPVAVQAFSQTQLKELSISTAMDLQTAVPGLTVDAGEANPGQAQFAIRGRGLNYGAAAGGVETYFAEVPLSAPFSMPTLPVQFFDLQSLQVLKGPQGTLFGRSTTGGAVLLVPNAPTDQFGGYLRLQGGNYGDFQAEGAINLPLAGEKAELRVAGFDWQRTGYSRTFGGNLEVFTGPGTGRPAVYLPAQNYNDEDVQEIRATLLLRPTDTLTNSTIFTFHEDRNVTSAGAGLFANVFGAPGSPFDSVTPAPGYNTQRSYSDIPLGGNPPYQVWAIINTTSFKIAPNLTLKNIFGFIDSSGYSDDGTNADGSALSTIDLFAIPRPRRNYQTTDEVQLQGHNFDDRLDWTLGGLVDVTREPEGFNELNIAGTIAANGAGGPGYSTPFVGNDLTSFAVFGSATYKLTDQLSATAGYRHAWNNIQQTLATAFSSDLAAGPPTTPTPGTEQSFSTNQPGDTYNVDLEYNTKNNMMLYGGYRHGFKHGGYNTIAVGSATGLGNFGPETIDDFYAGLKTNFNLGRIPARFNIEGYWDLYHGQQTSYLTIVGRQLATITVNVPETTYRGFDLDFTVDPTPWLTLNGNYSYIDAYITNYIDQSCVVSNCGAPSLHLNLAVNPVPNVTPNKFLLSARFHGELPGDKGEIVFIPTVTYQDTFYTPYGRVLPQGEAVVFRQNFNAIAHGGNTIPDYALFNLRAEWNRVMGSRVSAALTLTNVFNQIYQLGDSTTLNFGVQGDAYGPPRMVTFELSTTF